MDTENDKKRITARNSKFLAEVNEEAEEIKAEEAEIDLYRPDMRPVMREEDPMTRAARRTAELRNHRSEISEGVDKFHIPKEVIPDGWTYEWKRHTVLGKEDPAYAVKLARDGWEPVPTKRHPELMPVNSSSAVILQDGQILMERPKEITDEARQRELRDARMQVSQKERQLSEAPNNQFGRNNKDSSLVKVNRSYESIPIPK